MRRRRFLAFTSAGLAGAAAAAPGEPEPPHEVFEALRGARLWGEGTMRFLGFAIYRARLWTGADFVPQQYAARTFALELRYERSFGGAAIAERSIAEMRRAGSFDEAQARAWRAELERAFPDVAPGDRLTGVHRPDLGTGFFHNARPTRTIVDALFGRLFFAIWLAETTSEPALRRELIRPGP
jgi:hypothetical protein